MKMNLMIPLLLCYPFLNQQTSINSDFYYQIDSSNINEQIVTLFSASNCTYACTKLDEIPTEFDEQNTFIFNENGVYTFYRKDENDTIYDPIQIEIMNMDHISPTLQYMIQPNREDCAFSTKEEGATIVVEAQDENDNHEQTNKISYSLIRNDQRLEQETNIFEVHENGKYILECKDSAGNITTKTIQVDCIDETAPQIDQPRIEGARRVDNKFYSLNHKAKIVVPIIEKQSGIQLDQCFLYATDSKENTVKVEGEYINHSLIYEVDIEDDYLDITIELEDTVGNHTSSTLFDIPLYIEKKKPTIQCIKGKTTKLNKKEWIGKDETFEFVLNDDKSGIHTVKTVVNGEEENIEFEKVVKEKKIEIDTKEYEDKNGLIEIQIIVEDHAGNSKEYKKQIYRDTKSPLITYYFDQTNTSNYYNKERTVTIRIQDPNFNEKSITCSEKLGAFTKINEDTYQTHFVFREDSKVDFFVQASDLLGHTSQRYSESFVIDTTSPIIRAEFEEGHSEYNRLAHKVSLRFIDDNLDTDSLDVNYPYEWQGDSILIHFNQEGTYKIECSIKDKAGNGTSYESSSFVLDMTDPLIQFTNVENNVSYCEDVSPIFYIYDEYLKDIEIECSNTLRYTKVADNTYQFENLSENDGIYTIRVTASDLANNQGVQMVSFTVNRFGSKYELSSFEKFNKNINEAFVLIESNVSKLMNRIFTITRNGKVLNTETVLQKSQVKEDGWSEYQYKLDQNMFEEDGTYRIYVSSFDGFRTNEKEIVFTKDETSPVITVSGIESNGNYNENTKSFTVYAQDNLSLQKLQVYINDECVFESSEMFMCEFTLLNSLSKQNIKVVAMDQTGNQSEMEITDILVTANILYRLFTSIYFYICIGLAVCYGYRKHK